MWPEDDRHPEALTRYATYDVPHTNLTDALVTGASFSNTTARGFTEEQLYSTASYQAKNLRRIDLSDNDLSGWDFSDQDLANASLEFTYSLTLSNAGLSSFSLASMEMPDAVTAHNARLANGKAFSPLATSPMDPSVCASWHTANRPG